MNLGDIFSDSTRVPLRDESLDWLDLPSEDFLDYARRSSAAGDEVPCQGEAFNPGATFLLAQAHRIWLTTKKIVSHFPVCPEPVIVDLGSYPFAIDRVIRRYLKKPGRLLATVNQVVSAGERAKLAELGIDVAEVNLDPLVAPAQNGLKLSDRLPLPDGSADLVILSHVIEHLYHPMGILREVARVLKPEGRLVLTTDNAFLLGGLLSYLNGSEFLHDPPENTSAMVFDEWRGHVRFFSEHDLRSLLSAAGLEVIECDLREVVYNSFPEEFFVEPSVWIPRWRAKLLTEFPSLRNEILMVAGKPAPMGAGPRMSKLKPELIRQDAAQLLRQFERSQCERDQSTVIDFAFGCRLLWGRWPTDEEIKVFRRCPPARGLTGLTRQLMGSREFAARQMTADLDLPAHDCILMTEVGDGLRYFFSVQDSFVGFPVAVGVYEPDVRQAFLKLVKPGMNCIDVGANLGYYSVQMGAIVREGGGHVYSFEPDAFAYGLLVKNTRENHLEDVISLMQVACGEHEGVVELVRDANPANYGGMFVRTGDMARGAGAPGTQVSLRRIDDMIDGSVKIGFVKIDAEGSELAVLRGMRRILSEHAPVLICEYNVAAMNDQGAGTADLFLEELAAAGYTLYESAAFGAGRATPHDPSSGIQFGNLVCLPTGVTPEVYFQE